MYQRCFLLPWPRRKQLSRLLAPPITLGPPGLLSSPLPLPPGQAPLAPPPLNPVPPGAPPAPLPTGPNLPPLVPLPPLVRVSFSQMSSRGLTPRSPLSSLMQQRKSLRSSSTAASPPVLPPPHPVLLPPPPPLLPTTMSFSPLGETAGKPAGAPPPQLPNFSTWKPHLAGFST